MMHMRDDLPVQMIEDIEGAYASQNRLLATPYATTIMAGGVEGPSLYL